MGKYIELQESIFSIFTTAGWISEGIKTYPSNFLATGTEGEFIRVNIVPSGGSVNGHSVSGILIIEIYTPANEGPKRSSEIADVLDKHFSMKSIATTAGITQLFASSMTPNGLDYANKSLVKSTVSLSFNHFRS